MRKVTPMRILTRIAAALVAALALVAFAVPTAATPTVPTQVSYVVLPHPDDEFQTWSMVEGSTSNYKVFILATHGEQTGYCDAPVVGAHPAPNPDPVPKWSAECSEARLNSWVGFFEQMGATDPTVPADFTALGSRGPFPANGVTLQRTDASGTVAADRTAQVWLAGNGYGALVAFDLGDGDLTADEVKWAIRTVRDNRAALGINATLPNWNVIGTFRNSTNPDCAVYAHADHGAVHSALWGVSYGFGYRSAATCATDPDANRNYTVTATSAAAGWATNSTLGAFETHYGWLSAYGLSADQSSIFMRPQSFWTRY